MLFHAKFSEEEEQEALKSVLERPSKPSTTATQSLVTFSANSRYNTREAHDATAAYQITRCERSRLSFIIVTTLVDVKSYAEDLHFQSYFHLIV